MKDLRQIYTSNTAVRVRELVCVGDLLLVVSRGCGLSTTEGAIHCLLSLSSTYCLFSPWILSHGREDNYKGPNHDIETDLNCLC
jgi:hypothetical protein